MITRSTAELVRWLNDAHAMELGLATVLESHARDAVNLPHMAEKLRLHAAESKVHADRMQKAIALIGGKISSGKALLGDIVGRLNALSTAMVRDPMVKNALMDYATEHFEIACYRSLIAGAEALGLPQVAEICRENLREELAMAKWLQSRIDETTLDHLSRAEMQAAA